MIEGRGNSHPAPTILRRVAVGVTGRLSKASVVGLETGVRLETGVGLKSGVRLPSASSRCE